MCVGVWGVGVGEGYPGLTLSTCAFSSHSLLPLLNDALVQDSPLVTRSRSLAGATKKVNQVSSMRIQRTTSRIELPLTATETAIGITQKMFPSQV